MHLGKFFPGSQIRGLCRLVILPITLAACDASLQPFAESDVYFTVLGYLDTDADTQFVRVVPLRPVVQRIHSEEIDATVRSVNVTDGSVVTWSDSVVSFPDSTFGHVFWAPFRVVPEHTYRIEVERLDGGMASAETTIPKRPGDPETVYGALNESADFAPLFWPGVTEVIAADVLYEIAPVNCLLPRDPDAPRYTFRIRYEGDMIGRRTPDNEWRFEFDLRGDREILMERLGISGGFCAILHRLEARLATPSAEFDPPGGVWDREVLIQPGTFSNVEGGLGFVGSVARQSVRWTLKPIAMTSLGYE